MYCEADAARELHKAIKLISCEARYILANWLGIEAELCEDDKAKHWLNECAKDLRAGERGGGF